MPSGTSRTPVGAFSAAMTIAPLAPAGLSVPTEPHASRVGDEDSGEEP